MLSNDVVDVISLISSKSVFLGEADQVKVDQWTKVGVGKFNFEFCFMYCV